MWYIKYVVRHTNKKEKTKMNFPVNSLVEITIGGQWDGPYIVTDKEGRTEDHIVLKGSLGYFEVYNDAPFNIRSANQ